MNNYEIEQYHQIENWKKDEPSVVSQAMDTILSPVTWLVNKVVPQAAIEGLLTSCDKVAELVTDTGDIIRDGKVNSIAELAHKDLKLSDNLADEVHNWAIGLAGVEGGATGAAGLLGLAADIPALITMSLRVIHKIGLCYGFECNSESDKQLVLAIMSAAGANTIEEKAVSVVLLQRMNVLVTKYTWKKIAENGIQNKWGVEAAIIAIRTLAKQLGINLTKRKSLQAIPIFGAGVGAAMNVSFVNDVAWAARRTFQERWLLNNNRITDNK